MTKTNPKKWTYERLKASASKYTSVKDWRLSEQSAYVTACARGLKDELTAHMQKKIVHGYWTEERILASAQKFDHISEWAKAESSAYGAAKRLGVHAKATAHMERIGNKKKRCIYSISVKGTKLIYIGLTGNAKRRWRDHLKTKRFLKLSKEFGQNSIVFEKLTEYIPVDQAVSLESQYLQEYQANGYQLLNAAPTGSVGGTTVKWTKEEIHKDALRYNVFKDWITNSPNSYAAASALGIIDEVSDHLVRQIRKGGSWTKEEVTEEARKYNQVSEWASSDKKSYGAATRMGLLNDPDVVGHFQKNKVVNRKWTVAEIKRDALKYTTRSEWKRLSSGAYKSAKILGCFDECVSHMAYKPKAPKMWTEFNVLQDAKKYETKTDWKTHSAGAYQAAVRHGWLKAATQHMRVLNPKGKWAKKEAVIADARKYSYKSDWMTKSSGAYEAAKKMGCFEEATKHMPKRMAGEGKWNNKDAIIADARKYVRKSDWISNSSGAYEAAKKMGCFEEATQHMPARAVTYGRWARKEDIIEDAQKYMKRVDWKKKSSGAYAAAKKRGYLEEATAHMR